jgi:hypothetical protein
MLSEDRDNSSDFHFSIDLVDMAVLGSKFDENDIHVTNPLTTVRALGRQCVRTGPNIWKNTRLIDIPVIIRRFR